MSEKTQALIRTNGAYKESIPGIGNTIRGEAFVVEDADARAALLEQKGRFEPATAAQAKKAVKVPEPEPETQEEETQEE